MLAVYLKTFMCIFSFYQYYIHFCHIVGENMNQEKLAKLQAQVRIGGKVSVHPGNGLLF